jgi:dephospho-CoA kinase
MLSKKLFVGVTGGIGSGKSAVCNFLRELGCIVIDSDKLAKKLYKTSFPLKNKLIKEFSPGILDKKGKIDLAKLREIVFRDNKKQKRVNEIVHPFVINEKLKIYRRIKSGIVVTEAALIYESGSDKYLDYVILVYSGVKKRIERIRKRSGLSSSAIKKIMKLQMSENRKLNKADFILKNAGSLKELEKQTYFIYKLLCTLVK